MTPEQSWRAGWWAADPGPRGSNPEGWESWHLLSFVLEVLYFALHLLQSDGHILQGP